MINNIELIKPLLNFSEDGDFYMLYILKRKKDQITDKENHQSVRTIKTYSIESIEYLEKRYDEIIQLSEMFKARVYIHVQKQNHKDVSLEMMMALAQRIRDGQHKQINLFDSVVGQIKTQEKRWVVDVDTQDERVVDRIAKLINLVYPQHEGGKIEARIPTKNGYHFITKPFNVNEFRHIMSAQGDIPDIQKKNPTLLYYPNSLETN